MNWRLGFFNFIFLALVVILDQVSKSIFFSYDKPVWEFMNSWLSVSLQPSLNRGLAFSIPAPVAVVFSVVVIVFLLVLALWVRSLIRGKQDSIFLALILGGGLGNIIDRLIYGGVIDWVEVSFFSFSWSSFNIADAAIVFGVLGAFLFSVFEKKQSNV